MVKIIGFYPDALDASSFYRAVGPLHELDRIMDVKVDYHSKVNWAVIKGYDIVFIQRPFVAQHVEACAVAKLSNKKIWLDFDDLLLNLPNHNNVCKSFSKYEVTECVKKCCKYADLITVSTYDLKEELKNFNDNIVVIPNALDDYTLNVNRPVKPIGNRIIWRGSETHKKDLKLFAPVIIDAAKSFPDFSWLFMGYNPAFITNHIEKVEHSTGMDIVSYFRFLESIEKCLFIVPLEDTTFNRCKSNIAAIEASYSGCTSLVPDWKSWSGGNLLRYNSIDSFKEQLFKFLNNYGKLKIVENTYWDYVKENLLLSEVNKKRKEVINALL